MPERLIPEHGGYRKLKSFQISQLIYDVTVRFCDRYIEKRSRTHDQMVQAARSGVQNIAEGSQASGTSKKFELKLTSVARASLEELKLDYEDFLRQRNMPMLSKDSPELLRLKQQRLSSVEQFATWVANERCQSTTSVSVRENRSSALFSSCLPANGALSLLNLACYLLDKQIDRLAVDFESQGGFTERLYRVRSNSRRHS